MQRKTSRRNKPPLISPRLMWLRQNQSRFEESYRSRKYALREYRILFGGPRFHPFDPEAREELNKFLDTVRDPVDILDYEFATGQAQTQ